MYKIDRIMVAIGGIGQRAGCPEKKVPSKCFLKVKGVTLLEIIIKNILDTVGDAEIEIVVTNIEQEKMTHRTLSKYSYSYHIIYNDANDIFYLINEKKNTMIVYGDTYFPNDNPITTMVDLFKKNGCTQFMLLETQDGIDNVIFDIDENRIIKQVKKGKQEYEASQVFIFSKDDCIIIRDKIKNMNRFELIYSCIMKKSICYAHFSNCLNINTVEQCLKLGIEY